MYIMGKSICNDCKKVLEQIDGNCPDCGEKAVTVFKNNDSKLKAQAANIAKGRQISGLEGLVGDLQVVIINVEQDNFKSTIEEFLKFTGLQFQTVFETGEYIRALLSVENSADFIIQYRKNGNPFKNLNTGYPKSNHLPNTRLETLVFETADIKKYVGIQKQKGIKFLSKDIIENDKYLFVQSKPSKYTYNSIGVIQFKNEVEYIPADAKKLDLTFEKPDTPELANIKHLDHIATRIKAKHRDKAICEFMELTNYNFNFAIYVKDFNSITNVARLENGRFAMVFTSGISEYIDNEHSGPTEKFVHNYGPRVHHLAFHTENIEQTFNMLKTNGMEFLLEFVGGPEQGLNQTFSKPSKNTLLVNEYILRYGDFNGFFTKSNVTLLTEATDKQ